jgi:methionyl-tRNA formyltransferase
LQTLHTKTFDHGAVLAQTPYPGIPVPENSTLESLHDLVTPIGAQMLVQALRDGLHVPPLTSVGWEPDAKQLESLEHAPKLTKHDRQIRWETWSAAEFLTRQRVLGPLWSLARNRDGAVKRLILEGVEDVPYPPRMVGHLRSLEGSKEGGDEVVPPEDMGRVAWLWKPESKSGEQGATHQFEMPYFVDEDGEGVFVPAAAGGCLRVARVKAEGEKSKPAAGVFRGFGENGENKAAPGWMSANVGIEAVAGSA